MEFPKIVIAESKKSTCDRGPIGAGIFSHTTPRIYLGHPDSPDGLPNCSEVGHLLVDNHCVRTIHAEVKAIEQAIQDGHTDFSEDTLFVTHTPCEHCMNIIIESHFKRLAIQDNSWFPESVEDIIANATNLEVTVLGE